MATVSHTIYSHYDPQEREKLQRETGQLHDEQEDAAAEAWQAESFLVSRRRAPPPYFVPATASHGEYGTPRGSSSRASGTKADSLGGNLAGWYRSLRSDQGDDTKQATSGGETSESSTTQSVPPSKGRHTEKRTKNNWFIMNAIQSEHSPSSSTPPPPSSLADILARDPPPLPSERPYTPPVFLSIGPSNKGFAMLQRSGWNEGEALGPGVHRRAVIPDLMPESDMIVSDGKRRAREPRVGVKPEIVEIDLGEFNDVRELRKVDVIDLTLSESDSDDGGDGWDLGDDDAPILRDTNSAGLSSTPDSPDDGRTALLTPIATVLKSDRLGIGLKAKTVGPYKASQKRVTHNAAAMTAHIRAAEEIRRRKKERGRGRRGFGRQQKQEESSRKRMLAYLND